MNLLNRRIGFACTVLTLLICTQSGRVLADTDDGLLQVVKLGMRQACQSVKSFRGTVHQSNWVKDGATETLVEGTASGVFDGSRFRISVQGTVGTTARFEGYYDGVLTTELLGAGFPPRPGARIYEGMKGLAAASFTGMLSPLGHGLNDYSDEPGLKVVGREVLDGDNCVVVEVDAPVGTDGNYVKNKSWVDSDKGFTIPRAEVSFVSSTGKSGGSQVYVTKLKSYGDGVWGPSSYTLTQTGSDGTKIREMVLTYAEDFRINAPPSEATVSELVLPSGTEVDNEALDIDYRVP